MEVESRDEQPWDEGTKNGPDRSALLGHNFVYQETWNWDVGAELKITIYSHDDSHPFGHPNSQTFGQ